MQTRLATSFIKLLIVLLLVCILYALWRRNQAPNPQRREEPGETEVAVQVGNISLKTLRHYVTAFGTVEPEPALSGKPAASAKIMTPLMATVAEVSCIEGGRVEKGQTVFTLDGRDVEARIERTQNILAAAQRTVDQQEKNSKQDAVSQLLLAKAKQDRDSAQSELNYALAQRSLLKVVAPFSGTVVHLNVRPGEVANPESTVPLVTLVDLKRLIVSAAVPISHLSEIQPGQPVEVTFLSASRTDSLESGNRLNSPPLLYGKVAYVEALVDAKTDMGSVDISLPIDGPLRLGQFVRVRIVTDERRDCLAVPSRSVAKNEAGESVIYLVSGKTAIQQAVKVGFREDDMVQVHSLVLKPGDKIITIGAHGLPEKSKIRILND